VRDNYQRTFALGKYSTRTWVFVRGFFIMAKDKKSFLLYCDLIHTVEQLTNEQAGDLFKHILKYVNDENPQTENVITKIAFEPIKQSLKRDLQKYEDIRKRNSDNARKRWYATAYDRIPNDTKNADSVSVSVSDSEKEIKRFNKPSVEEVREYMLKQGMNDISENWLNHYESNGWMVGKNKMKDWKASVRTWKTNQKNNLQSQQVIHKNVFTLKDYE
jgi:hypothetical protein